LVVGVVVQTLPETTTGLLVAPVVVAQELQTEPEEQRQPDKGLPVEQVTPTKVAEVVEVPALLGRTLQVPIKAVPVVLAQRHIHLGVSLPTRANSLEQLAILPVVVAVLVSRNQVRVVSAVVPVVVELELVGRQLTEQALAVVAATSLAQPAMVATGF
jgi:hypothetical protein